MGLIRDEIIYKIKSAPFGDPTEYIIKNYHNSLRNNEANKTILEII